MTFNLHDIQSCTPFMNSKQLQSIVMLSTAMHLEAQRDRPFAAAQGDI